MKFTFPPPEHQTLAVVGKSERYPVNRIFCVGRNYASHAREMGSDPELEPPFFFMKPASALVEVKNTQASIPYPPMTNNFHHEIELVVAIGLAGIDITQQDACNHIYGYAIGLDMTRRDLQINASKAGRPWEFGKSMANSAVIGPIHPVSSLGHMNAADIKLYVNGEIRQSSNINAFIWSVPDIISYLSRYEALHPGDLIMTGTPEGVGPVVEGDVMHGTIETLGEIIITIR